MAKLFGVSAKVGVDFDLDAVTRDLRPDQVQALVHGVGNLAIAYAELSQQEWQAFIEQESMTRLGIGSVEFTRRWEAGEWDNDSDPAATRIAMLLGIA